MEIKFTKEIGIIGTSKGFTIPSYILKQAKLEGIELEVGEVVEVIVRKKVKNKFKENKSSKVGMIENGVRKKG